MKVKHLTDYRAVSSLSTDMSQSSITERLNQQVPQLTSIVEIYYLTVVNECFSVENPYRIHLRVLAELDNL